MYTKTVLLSIIHAHSIWNLKNCSNLPRFPFESSCSADANQLNTSSTWFLTRNFCEAEIMNLLRESFFSKSPTLIVLMTLVWWRFLVLWNDLPAVVVMLMMKKKNVNVMRWNFMFLQEFLNQIKISSECERVERWNSIVGCVLFCL